MKALLDRQSLRPPPATGPALIPPVGLLVISTWGLLACWNRPLFGWQVGAPLTRWLGAALGAEGIDPGRDLLGKVFFLALLVSVIWLLALRRILWQAHDPYVQEMVLDLKAATTTLLVFLAFLGGTLVFLVRNAFGGPGTWLDDTLGTPALGYWGVAGLALVTVILGLALRHLNRRLRHHPVYGREPRR
jgi:hypothetical protein